MKEVLGALRRADERYGLIADGDRIAVGVSGGKDSFVTLLALDKYRLFSRKKYEIEAITIGMGFGADYEPIRAWCEAKQIPYTFHPTRIGPVVFEERKEKNPCALCAVMRRGALHNAAVARGCNKVALGHHLDDGVETLLLSLVEEGRLHTFQPASYLSRKNITVIRPLLFVPETATRRVASQEELPVIASGCPADGKTRRAFVKDLVASLETSVPDIRKKLRSALMNTEQYGLWDGEFPR